MQRLLNEAIQVPVSWHLLSVIGDTQVGAAEVPCSEV